MPKVILDVPEEVAEKLRSMEAKLKAMVAAAREGAAELDVDSALVAVDEAVDATALEMKRRVLQGLDTDAPRLLIDGELHARVGRYTATYKTRQCAGAQVQVLVRGPHVAARANAAGRTA
ncbi:hypothetical protein [Pyxidicoccus trucidator]|uniref:hypothetical protein n=1 Tax=Pyxidicoccus trucidator TaxID=2709662 RepID=UPI0013DBC6A2|nr:hypothetical protein [Pyxidicoccus trucidator]